MADTYVGTVAASEQVTSLMRRINALEASASSVTGTFISEFGSTGAPSGIRSNGSNVVVMYLNGYSISEWTTAGVFVSGAAGTFTEVLFDIDGSGNIYGAFENIPTATTSTVYKSDSSYSPITSWTHASMQDCICVCVDSSHVYVSDYVLGKIIKFTHAGTYVSDWSVGASTQGGYVTLHPSGDIVVATTSTIKRYTNTGSLVSSISLSAKGMAFDSSGNLYAVSHPKVYVYDSSFAAITNFGTAGTGSGQFSAPQGCTIDSEGYLHVSDSSRKKIIKFTTEVNSTGVTQTPWNSYTTTTATSLGTPDGGVSVPDLNALNANGAGPIPRHIVDMRDAIETLAPYFTNAVTGNPFNWTASSSDNLYYVAMGDRSDYGATGGAAYDWTRTEAQMEGDFAYSIDIGEIEETVSLLEAS